MKRESAERLKNHHIGEDIYVLGSGASMGFINHKFFYGKITIGANSIWKYFSVTYSLFKHEPLIDKIEDNKAGIIIASLHDCGDLNHPINNNKKVDYIFTHKKGRFEDLEGNFQTNLDAIGKDNDIFVSYSTITSCIHLAAYMGAANIILCGHDCGWIDKISHIKDYADHLKDFHKEAFNDYHNMWFKRADQDTKRLKTKLKEVYGCEVYSLNPFINFRMEGHDYDTKI